MGDVVLWGCGVVVLWCGGVVVLLVVGGGVGGGGGCGGGVVVVGVVGVGVVGGVGGFDEVMVCVDPQRHENGPSGTEEDNEHYGPCHLFHSCLHLRPNFLE